MLQGKPPRVAVAFAARAALRVLPIVMQAQRKAYRREFFADAVLPVFRATGVAWVAAKYSTLATKLGATAHAAAFTARAAIEAADAAFAAAFWFAVSADASRIEGGISASVMAGTQMWPEGPPPARHGQPERLRSLWREMKKSLIDAGQEWDVWTNWHEDRLAGRVRDEEIELAYVQIDNDLWDRGPAIVNAEIKRRIAALRWAKILGNLPEVPLGNKWVESDDRLAIDPGGRDNDDAAAHDPVVCQLHEAVKRKAREFARRRARGFLNLPMSEICWHSETP